MLWRQKYVDGEAKERQNVNSFETTSKLQISEVNFTTIDIQYKVFDLTE